MTLKDAQSERYSLPRRNEAESNPRIPGQVSDEERPSSVLDANVEPQKRERNLKTYEDY
jgi:hypothetical protein